VKGYGPATPDQEPRFAGEPTFLRLPHVNTTDDVDVAVVGVPFDASTRWRAGTRFGPTAIRDASLTMRPFFLPAQRIAPFDYLSAVDAGDAQVVPGFTDRTFDKVAARLGQLHAADVTPLCLGGDASILLAELRAAAQRHGPLALVLFDAHTDTWDESVGERYVHGTVVRRAAEEGLIDPARSFLFGARGGTASPTELDEARALGFTVVPWDDLAQIGTGMAAATPDVADGKAFLSFDVDFVDPAFAPGVSAPEPGGPSSMQALALLRGCRGLRIVGADVNSVVPKHDPGTISAALAATVAFEIMALIACERKDRERAAARAAGGEAEADEQSPAAPGSAAGQPQHDAL
jgi:agmatinase